jgi:hypothetical protein
LAEAQLVARGAAVGGISGAPVSADIDIDPDELEDASEEEVEAAEEAVLFPPGREAVEYDQK